MSSKTAACSDLSHIESSRTRRPTGERETATQLRFALDEEEQLARAAGASAPAGHGLDVEDRSGPPAPRRRRARRLGIGDIVEVERSEWLIVDVDLDQRTFLCRLLRGSRVLRRFRAGRIKLLRAGDAES
jgi:hypothetical protein